MTNKILTVFLLTLCSGSVIYIFWNEQVQYARPTAVPAHYSAVVPGDSITLPVSLNKNTAYFLHFYNPDCPCSRFNAKHIQSLITNYGSDIQFIIVIEDVSNLETARNKFGYDLKYITDPHQEIARACGVYSTPQAAIITKDHHLFYRGNYNQSRYCTTRATNYAELSLLALLNNQPRPVFGLLATQSYGCELGHSSINPLAF